VAAGGQHASRKQRRRNGCGSLETKRPAAQRCSRLFPAQRMKTLEQNKIRELELNRMLLSRRPANLAEQRARKYCGQRLPAKWLLQQIRNARGPIKSPTHFSPGRDRATHAKRATMLSDRMRDLRDSSTRRTTDSGPSQDIVVGSRKTMARDRLCNPFPFVIRVIQQPSGMGPRNQRSHRLSTRQSIRPSRLPKIPATNLERVEQRPITINQTYTQYAVSFRKGQSKWHDSYQLCPQLQPRAIIGLDMQTAIPGAGLVLDFEAPQSDSRVDKARRPAGQRCCTFVSAACLSKREGIPGSLGKLPT